MRTNRAGGTLARAFQEGGGNLGKDSAPAPAAFSKRRQKPTLGVRWVSNPDIWGFIEVCPSAILSAMTSTKVEVHLTVAEGLGETEPM